MPIRATLRFHACGRRAAGPARRAVAACFALVSAAVLLAHASLAAAGDGEVWLRAPGADAIAVATTAEFDAALRRVKAGGAIVLAPGRYDRLAIRGFERDDYVVIRSADPTRPAEIGKIDVDKSRHLWFQQLRLAASGPTSDRGAYIARIRNSRDVGVVASEVHGTIDRDHGNDPKGVNFHTVDRVVFAGNRLYHLARGVVFEGVRHARVVANQFFELRSDGADFAGVQDVLIEGNLFSTFYPAPKDHPDFIQFWQRNAPIEDTRRVVIRGNTFLQGRGEATQTIFICNKIAGRVYRDFVIENNVIYNAHPHGITLCDLDGGRVANNTLVVVPNGHPKWPDDKAAPRINLQRARNVEVVANVMPRLLQEGSHQVTLQRNLLTGDAGLSNTRHPRHLFVDALAGARAETLSFAPRPGGLLDLPPGERIGALAIKDARAAR